MVSTTTKVALITGGSGGIGLAVARALASQGEWQIHILDVKEEEGQKVASTLPNTFFHKTDLTKYDEVGAAFKAAYLSGGNRLDFVFANAGVIDKKFLFDLKSDSLDPPPRPDYAAVEINLQGAIDTVHIARHFMLRSQEKAKGSIVITASCSSVWPTFWAPIYTASKFGILGFMRAIAGHCQIIDGIRVNALLPGAVKTPILEWGDFPEDAFTPPELIAEVVFKLAAGEEIVDSKGAKIPTEKAYGQAVIVTGKKYYIHPETEYCDEVMATTIEATKVENRLKDT